MKLTVSLRAEGVNNVLWHSVALYLEREKRVHLEGLEDGSLSSAQVQGRLQCAATFMGRSRWKCAARVLLFLGSWK